MFSRNAILAALQVVLFLNAVWVIWKDGISDYLFPAGARRFSSANQRVRLIHGNPPSSNFGPLLNGRPASSPLVIQYGSSERPGSGVSLAVLDEADLG